MTTEECFGSARLKLHIVCWSVHFQHVWGKKCWEKWEMLHMACSSATNLSSNKSKLSMDFSQTITQWDVTTSRDRASLCRHFIMGLCDKAINGVILLLIHLSVSIIDILCWLTHLTSGHLSPVKVKGEGLCKNESEKWNRFWEDISFACHLLPLLC